MRDEREHPPGQGEGPPRDDQLPLGRVARRLRDADRSRGAVHAARTVRRLAPGGESLDEDAQPRGDRTSDRLARLIDEVGGQRPSAARELGLAAVAVWQAVGRRRGLGRDGAEVTILFTDLVEFSSWALRVGDDLVLRLLRKVGRVCTDAAARHRGSVVKSLGDGMMVVFADPVAAIDAGHQMCTAVSALDLDGYRPRLRAGLHTGHPRSVGRDYLGVDVNIAARVADAASAGQLLVTGAALAGVDAERYTVRRRRGFRAKGAPSDLEVYSVIPRYDQGS